MQDERAAGSEPDELTAPDTGQHPMPPLYGTKESAAGLPYAAPASDGYVPGAGPPPGDAIAGPGRRLGARLLDILCVGIAILVVQALLWLVILTSDPRLRRLLVGYADDMTSEQRAAELQQAIAPWAWLSTLVLLLVWFLYEVPLTAARGQTLGKLALGIRIVGSGHGGRVGWGPATSRWAILALPSLIGVFGLPFQAINCGWLLRDKETRRCLHDKAASTYVVQATGPPTR